MTTIVDLSESLLSEAMKITQIDTEKGVVELALKELIRKAKKTENHEISPITESLIGVIDSSKIDENGYKQYLEDKYR